MSLIVATEAKQGDRNSYWHLLFHTLQRCSVAAQLGLGSASIAAAAPPPAALGVAAAAPAVVAAAAMVAYLLIPPNRFYCCRIVCTIDYFVILSSKATELQDGNIAK